MSTELIDLMPEERRRTLRRSYFLRLGVVITLLLALLIVSAAALLLPTYVYLSEKVNTENALLTSIDAGLASADGTALSDRLATLSSDAALLSTLGSTPSATAIITKALAVAHPGVTLSGFSYTPAGRNSPGTLVIGGIAATRDGLRSYQLALQGASFASAADLPVSAYAQNTDIAFSITVTLAP